MDKKSIIIGIIVVLVIAVIAVLTVRLNNERQYSDADDFTTRMEALHKNKQKSQTPGATPGAPATPALTN